jgi:hypothetical protein
LNNAPIKYWKEWFHEEEAPDPAQEHVVYDEPQIRWTLPIPANTSGTSRLSLRNLIDEALQTNIDDFSLPSGRKGAVVQR